MTGRIRPPSPRDALIAMSRHSSFKTGSIPGKPISTKFASVFGEDKLVHKAANTVRSDFILTRKHLVLGFHLNVELKAYFQFPLFHQVLKFLSSVESLTSILVSCIVVD